MKWLKISDSSYELFDAVRKSVEVATNSEQISDTVAFDYIVGSFGALYYLLLTNKYIRQEFEQVMEQCNNEANKNDLINKVTNSRKAYMN